MNRFLAGFGIITALVILFTACSSTRKAPAGNQMAETIPVPASPIAVNLAPEELSSADKATHYYFEGVRLANIHENLTLARDCYSKALEYDSLHAPSYYELANIYAVAQAEKALEYSTRANRIDTTNIWYKHQLGRLLIMNQEYHLALKVYETIVRETPNSPDNYWYLSALHNQLGNRATAIVLLDSAEIRFGMIPELSAYKRQLLMEAGQTDRAVEETIALANNFPYDATNYVLLGELYARSNRDSLAIEAYTQALDIDPNSSEALVALIEFHRVRNDTHRFLEATKRMFESDAFPLDTKLDFFKEVIQNPQFYQRHYGAVNNLVTTLAIKHAGSYEVAELYAQHQINSGDTPAALETLKNALHKDSPVEHYLFIMDIETYFENTDSMLHYVGQAIEKHPDNPDLYIKKGYGLFYLKKYREAFNAMQEALSKTESDSVKSAIWAGIGDMTHAQDSSKKKKYYKCYEKALELDPNNIHALNNYAYFLSVEGKNLDQALKMIERVMETGSTNPTYIDTYGWVLYKLGRYDDAKRVMRQAVSLDAGASKELMLHYGDILYELNEHFMATVYWKKAQEKGYDAGEIEKRLKMVE